MNLFLLTRSTWQHAEQQKLLCYLKVQCIQSSETGSEMHFIPALKSSHRYEWILFQVIYLLREMLIIAEYSGAR